MRNNRTYQIAFSGISAAAGVIFLLLATYLPVAKLGLLACSTVALFLPFSMDMPAGGILCYLATGVLAFFVGGTTTVLAYAAFFGLQPIVIYLFKRFRLKLVLRLILGAAFAALVLFLFWKFAVLLELLTVEAPLWALEVVGIPVFLAYEYLMERVYDQVGRMGRKFGKR